MENDPQQPSAAPTRRVSVTAAPAGQPGFIFRETSEPGHSGGRHDAAWDIHPPITSRPLSPAALSDDSDYVEDLDEGRPTIEDRLIPVWEIYHVQNARRQGLIEQRAEQFVREAIQHSGKRIHTQSEEYANLLVKTITKLAERYDKAQMEKGSRPSTAMSLVFLPTPLVIPTLTGRPEEATTSSYREQPTERERVESLRMDLARASLEDPTQQT